MDFNDCYNVNDLPLSDDLELRVAQEKIINEELLSFREKIILGRDHTIKEIEGYKLRPDCVYRAISEELYDKYCETGFIYGVGVDDEYVEGVNNKGVDWYLGGVCLRYGDVIIECPAYREYFVFARDYGCHMAFDPYVRHMKSSGYRNPVPMSLIKVVKHPKMENVYSDKKVR